MTRTLDILWKKDEDILQIHEDILKKKEYEEIPICTLKRVNDEMVGRTVKIAAEIQKILVLME